MTVAAVSRKSSTDSSPIIKAYLQLLKPGVMSLTVFTSLSAMIISYMEIDDKTSFSLFCAIISLIAIALGSGGAAALNMWYDADIDAKMQRTKLRPIPGGILTEAEVLEFALLLCGLSILLLWVSGGFLAALWLAVSIMFYIGIYTMWLKRSTVYNIVIGGAAGSIPPMIGEASIKGYITWESVILFVIIFLWTPPHFWALAIKKHDEYKAVNVPMLPGVKGVRATKRQILWYSILLCIVSFLPFVFHYQGLIYLVVSSYMGLKFVHKAAILSQIPDSDTEATNKYTMTVFGYSIYYLFALFTVAVVDKIWL